MLHVPGQAEIGIMILDRDTGTHSFVGRDDLEPLAFNEATNRLFAGVQVGLDAAVVDGATDTLTAVNLDPNQAIGSGIGDVDVRWSSDNAYMANQSSTFAVNGASRCVQRLATGVAPQGGLVVSKLAVNQGTGRVYVTNHQDAATVSVIQDGTVPCAAPPPTGGGGGGGESPAPDTAAPVATMAVPKQGLAAALRRGLRVTVGCSEACTTRIQLVIDRRTARRVGLSRTRAVVVGTRAVALASAGRRTVHVAFKTKARKRLRRLRTLALTVRATATDKAGNEGKRLSRTVRLRRSR